MKKKRQKLLNFMCWLIYVVSYESRYSYHANIVAIKDYYGVTNSVMGPVGTCSFLVYDVEWMVKGFYVKNTTKNSFYRFRC